MEGFREFGRFSARNWDVLCLLVVLGLAPFVLPSVPARERPETTGRSVLAATDEDLAQWFVARRAVFEDLKTTALLAYGSVNSDGQQLMVFPECVVHGEGVSEDVLRRLVRLLREVDGLRLQADNWGGFEILMNEGSLFERVKSICFRPWTPGRIVEDTDRAGKEGGSAHARLPAEGWYIECVY